MDWPALQPHTYPPTPSPQLSALPAPPDPPAFTAPLTSAQPFFSPPLAPARPRLKRSHPTAHSALPSGPVPAVQPVPTSPTGGASPHSHARTRSTSSNASLSTLEPIKEWPGAEGDVSSGSSLGLNLEVQPQGRVGEDDGTLERAPKRVRGAPDHEAFGRLSLSTAAGPASPTSLTYSPLSTVPSTLPTPFMTQGAPPPTPLLLNTTHLPPSTLARVSFPLPGPPTFTPSYAPSSSPPLSAPSLPAAPPTSPVQSSSSTSGLRSPLVPVPSAGGGTSLPTVPWSQSSFISAPSPASLDAEEAGQAKEVDMRPASSSWSTGPHTIYVSSLDSDSDTEPPSPSAVKQVEVNPLALKGGTDDPAARLLVRKLHEAASSSSTSAGGAGSLILYRPPPSFAPPAPSSSPEPESTKDRIPRERRTKRDSDEWGEFVRMREREEAMHDLGDDEGKVEEEDGMEMD